MFSKPPLCETTMPDLVRDVCIYIYLLMYLPLIHLLFASSLVDKFLIFTITCCFCVESLKTLFLSVFTGNILFTVIQFDAVRLFAPDGFTLARNGK